MAPSLTARIASLPGSRRIDASADNCTVTLKRDVVQCDYLLTTTTCNWPSDAGFDGDVYVTLQVRGSTIFGPAAELSNLGGS